MKKVLNVGGHTKVIPLPNYYAGYEHLLLDIDPKGSPDILCDARTLATLEADQFDAVYCSHNLEHYYHHEVRMVLAGFLHVIKDDGFVDIRVPDIGEVMKTCISQGLDIEDALYQSPAGPMTVLDLIYGWSAEIEESGQDFFAHKTGFTPKSLIKALTGAGFVEIYSASASFEVRALAFKQSPGPALRAVLGLPDRQ